MAKYDPLYEHLRAQPRSVTEVRMTFEAVARLVGSLPPSAWKHRAWRANDVTHVMAKAWLDAGWLVDTVDQKEERVTFRRA